MNKFLFYCASVSESSAIIDGDDFIHCTKSLRKKLNDEILFTDGKGKLYHGKISTIDKKSLTLQITHQEESPARLNKLHIAIAPTKSISRIETMIEKAVEIGIERISMIFSQNSERKNVKLDRLNKIALSAMKQSFRTQLPIVDGPYKLKEFVKDLPKKTQKLILHYEEDATHLADLEFMEDNLMLIGPEGDFTAEEINSCKEAGFQVSILGNARLRTETAGIVACSIFNVINR